MYNIRQLQFLLHLTATDILRYFYILRMFIAKFDYTYILTHIYYSEICNSTIKFFSKKDLSNT